MKTSSGARRMLATAGATIVLAGVGVGAFAIVTSDGGETTREAPAPQEKHVPTSALGSATDAGPNPWAANDLATVLRALEQGAFAGTAEFVDPVTGMSCCATFG